MVASVFGCRKTYSLCQRERRLRGLRPLNRGKGLDNAVVVVVVVAICCLKTSAQVLLRWALQNNVVVIPKSLHESRVHENANVHDFAIADADMASFDAIAD